MLELFLWQGGGVYIHYIIFRGTASFDHCEINGNQALFQMVRSHFLHFGRFWCPKVPKWEFLGSHFDDILGG